MNWESTRTLPDSGSAKPLAVSRIGKYEIVAKLGEGATSTVYLADDPFLDRQVAIKHAFPEALSSQENGKLYKSLFVTEASLVGKLVHPHIVAIYDAVVDDDSSYIVMEFVSGGTLEKYCRPENLLPIDSVVEIIFKCCRALDFAFRNGVIHRDIKPANILLSSNTDIKISDFGAALIHQSERTQVTGIGSPAYMSPEQIQDGQLTQQTDIYSLGVVMYHLLTGKLPFHASNHAAMVYQITSVTPPAVNIVRPDVPETLARIVQNAMHKDAEKRYPTWDKFSQELVQAFKHLVETQEEFSDTEKFNTLRKLKFFKTFTDVELWEVLRISSWQKIPGGTVIINEGDIGRSFYVLAEGEAKVSKRGKILHTLSMGECFGEMAYLSSSESKRTATVITVAHTTLIKIKAAALSQASEPCVARFSKAFLDILVTRLTVANTKLSVMV